MSKQTSRFQHVRWSPWNRARPRIRLVVGIVAGLVGVIHAQEAPMPVSVASVVQRDVSAGQTFVGTVLPTRVSTVGSAVADRVVEFPVNEGDRVERGQLLARLRTQALEIQLAAARSELELRRQELAELENGSRPEEITQARARMLSAKALMAYTKTRLDRYQRLYKKDTAAEDEMNEAVSAHDQATQAYEEAKAALALAVEGPRKEKIAQARARANAQEEEIRRIEDEIERHRIVAPFDGYVVAEHTEVGQWLAVGDAVIELAELDIVDVRVQVLEDYIRHVRIGTEARVELGGLPDRAFAGPVVLIVPQADVRSRCFPVNVRLKNQPSGTRPRKRGTVDDIVLKAGMFARVTLPVGNRVKAIMVPKDALVLGGPAPVVYALDPEAGDAKRGKVRQVQVVLGVASGGLIQVEGSLAAGQQVVVRGNERLRPNQAVVVTRTIPVDQVPQPGVAARAQTPSTAPTPPRGSSGTSSE